jgi:hypothetical protein
MHYTLYIDKSGSFETDPAKWLVVGSAVRDTTGGCLVSPEAWHAPGATQRGN